jgi:hypothetical protein
MMLLTPHLAILSSTPSTSTIVPTFTLNTHNGILSIDAKDTVEIVDTRECARLAATNDGGLLLDTSGNATSRGGQAKDIYRVGT